MQAVPERIYTMKHLKHKELYEYWRLNGRNLTVAAKKAKLTRKTVRGYRDNEDWVERANQADADQALEVVEQDTKNRSAGEKAVDKARLNHRSFQQCVMALNLAAIRKLNADPNMVDALDIEALVKLNTADARITAILHPDQIPQRLEVSRAQAPAEQIKLEIVEAEAEFERVTKGA